MPHKTTTTINNIILSISVNFPKSRSKLSKTKSYLKVTYTFLIFAKQVSELVENKGPDSSIRSKQLAMHIQAGTTRHIPQHQNY